MLKPFIMVLPKTGLHLKTISINTANVTNY